MFENAEMAEEAYEAATKAVVSVVASGDNPSADAMREAGEAWRAFIEGAGVDLDAHECGLCAMEGGDVFALCDRHLDAAQSGGLDGVPGVVTAAAASEVERRAKHREAVADVRKRFRFPGSTMVWAHSGTTSATFSPAPLPYVKAGVPE